MAPVAFQVGVFAFQRESGPVMIELVFTLGPVHEIKIPPGVIVVTVETGEAVVVDDRIVISPLVIESLSDQGMAGETLVGRRPFAQFMALGAIGYPFERFVGARQIARRQLPERRHREHHQRERS